MEIKKKRLLIPIPFGVAKFQAFFLQLIPNPLLTVDQVKLLQHIQHQKHSITTSTIEGSSV